MADETRIIGRLIDEISERMKLGAFWRMLRTNGAA